MADEKFTSVADVEFMADLANSGSQDPISKLGADPEQVINRTALVPMGERPNAQYMPAQDPSVDLVVADPQLTRPDVWNHEFRHRGLRLIRDLGLTEDEMKKEFGEAGVTASIYLTAWDDQVGHVFEEAVVEAGDNPDTTLNEGPARFSKMKDTISEVPLSPKDKQDVQYVLTRIAIDMLTDQGRWFESTKKEGPRKKFERVSKYPKQDVEGAKTFIASLIGQ